MPDSDGQLLLDLPGRTRKQYVAEEIKADDGDRTITAVINTADIDRDNEIVLPSGADLRDFRKNPVVLLAHRYDQPAIGRATKVTRSDGDRALVAKTQFAETPLGQEIFSLYAGGYMKAFSIGFDPDPEASGKPTEEELKQNPGWKDVRRVYRKWSLLEYSAVSVPSNPEALALSLSKGSIELCEHTRSLLSLPPLRRRVCVAIPVRIAGARRLVRSVQRVAPGGFLRSRWDLQKQLCSVVAKKMAALN